MKKMERTCIRHVSDSNTVKRRAHHPDMEKKLYEEYSEKRLKVMVYSKSKGNRTRC